MQLSGKKILVTGGDGFVGRHLVDKLVNLGNEVAIYDANINFANNFGYYQSALEIRNKIFKQKPSFFFRANILNKKKLKKAFDEFQPEIVVHLAAFPISRIDQKYEASMISINLEGTLNVLNVFNNNSSARRIIYSSSSLVYGRFRQSHPLENHPLDPVCLYGATKAAGEHFVKLSKKEWVIVRPTSIYGFTDCSNRVTQLLLDAAIQNKSAWVVRGEALDFSYIDDVVDGLIRCIFYTKAAGEVFNLSKGESRLVSDFAAILKKYYPSFNVEIRKPTNQQVWKGALDISKAKRLLTYKPKYSIEKGIERILKLIDAYSWKEIVYN